MITCITDSRRVVARLGFALAILMASWSGSNVVQANKVIVGEYVGSFPGADFTTSLFGIPSDAASPIRWHLKLHSDTDDEPPSRFHLSRDYNRQTSSNTELGELIEAADI